MNRTIVCFGDSNTYGYDTASGGRYPGNVRWTGVLRRELGEEYDVAEEGLCGRTASFDDPLMDDASGLLAIRSCLLTHSPVDLLTVMLGTNDTKQRFCATPRNIADGVGRVLERARETRAWSGDVPRILLICPPPVERYYLEGKFAGDMGEDCSRKAKALSPLYRQVAQEQGCAFLDAGTLVRMGKMDGMHLDPESHRMLGLAVAGIVRNLLAASADSPFTNEKL